MTTYLTTHGHIFVALFLALVAAAMCAPQWFADRRVVVEPVDERDFEANVNARWHS